jgi:hypothetical protein
VRERESACLEAEKEGGKQEINEDDTSTNEDGNDRGCS